MAVYKSKNPTKDGRQFFFRIKYKDVFGQTHDYTSPKFKGKKEATEEEALFRIKVQKQEICSSSSITLEQIYKEWIIEQSKQLKKQSLEKVKVQYSHLKPISKYKINELNLARYKQLVNHLESLDLTATYKNKILGVLKRIIIYSSKCYNTSDSILKFIEPFKDINKFKEEMKFFTYEEYLKFDSVIDDFKYHVFFEVLYFLGLRQGEAMALNWNDIDFKNKTINIRKTLTTKIKGENWTISTPKTKNSTRILPMTEKLLNDLLNLKNEAKKYTDYSKEWFVFGNSRPFAETTIQKKKNGYCDKAKLSRIRVHDFRHSCASLLINKGATPALVSKYLGHGSISVTLNVYTHMFKSELNKMTEILNQL